MAYQVRDKYQKKAKAEGLVARSAYKLDEIQKKHKILKPKDRVLDLGCTPGSWVQAAQKIVGPQGEIVGVDLNPCKVSFPNFRFIQGDMLELDQSLLGEELFDCVISDMAPSTTGNKFTDQARSHELCEMALMVAKKFLKPKGHFVAKYFMSNDFKDFQTQVRECFSQVKTVRPDSTRKTSTEVFVVGLGFLG